jgi:hypothetical protein
MTRLRRSSSIVLAMYVWREHPEFFRGAGGLIQRLRWWPSSYDVQARLISSALLSNDLCANVRLATSSSDNAQMPHSVQCVPGGQL